MNNHDLPAVAQQAVALARRAGANEAAAQTYRVRELTLRWRDGAIERITESTTRGVNLQLFAADRWARVSTTDLRTDALNTFIRDAIELAKSLERDPARALPDPELYQGQAGIDLRLHDPSHASVSTDRGRELVREMEEAARATRGSDAILSVSSSFSSVQDESFLVTSNGFSGAVRSTRFGLSCGVSAKDADGRRPEDYGYAGARHFADLPRAASIGAEAGRRALSRLGAIKAASGTQSLAIDNRVAGRLFGFLNQALGGGALQQRRSFLEGRLGQRVFSDTLTVHDDPLVPKGFGSQLFDAEGMAAKVRPIIEGGVLRNFYLDTYYSRKLKLPPTTGSPSNLAWKPGPSSQKALLAAMGDGILVTGFLGGNSNSGTGDFSIGMQGFRVRRGEIAEPVAEMNIAGNHAEFWQKLVATGNDPYPYSSYRTPTLVFEGVSVAGA
jgi:PmbA protein